MNVNVNMNMYWCYYSTRTAKTALVPAVVFVFVFLKLSYPPTAPSSPMNVLQIYPHRSAICYGHGTVWLHNPLPSIYAVHKFLVTILAVGVNEANLPIKFVDPWLGSIVYALVCQHKGAAQVVSTSPTFLYMSRTPLPEAVLATRGFT
jgi:hypothetical protein